MKQEILIPISVLREVLDACVEVGYINEYGAHRIVELIKHKLL